MTDMQICEPTAKRASTSRKLIYLAQRNRRLTKEEFVRRWRQHGAFAMGLSRWSSIRRCCYCDVLPPVSGIPWANLDYDGVATIWFRDSAPAAPEDRARLRADERETFVDHVETFSLDAQEEIVRPGGGLIKATLFVRDPDAADAESFATRWQEHAKRLFSLPQAALIGSYVRNSIGRNGFSAKSKMVFDGVAEYWFQSPRELRDFFSARQVRDVFNAGVERFADNPGNLLVVTNEVVLYDRAVAAWPQS